MDGIQDVFQRGNGGAGAWRNKEIQEKGGRTGMGEQRTPECGRNQTGKNPLFRPEEGKFSNTFLDG